MMDQIFDRAYQGGRKELHDGVDRAFARIANSTGTAFRVLNRINFDAPWKRRDRDQGAGCA